MTKPDAPQWYPWFWRDWQADYGVTRLSLAERGLYRELLDASWKVGGLPQNEQTLAELARCRLADFRRAWKAVRRFWPASPDGLLRNPKLEKVRSEQAAYRAKLAESGRKGGQSRSLAKQGSSLAKQAKQSKDCLTTAAGRGRWNGGPPAPTSLSTILPDCTGMAPIPPADPPTPAQAAELAAVRLALRGDA